MAEITLVLSAQDEHAESAVGPQYVPLAKSACVYADSLAVSQLPVALGGCSWEFAEQQGSSVAAVAMIR